MNGEIGVLYQDGRQIGGFYDWEITINLEQSSWGELGQGDWLEWQVSPQYITAVSYWLVHKPKDMTFRADFYQYIRNQLVLVDSSIVQIQLPEVNVIGKRLWAPIRMKWMNSLSF